MSRWAKLLERARKNPAGLRFKDLCALVERVGFVKRSQRGSHVVYKHPEIKGLRPLPLQQDKSAMAKPYQVRQFLGIIDTYNLKVE